MGKKKNKQNTEPEQRTSHIAENRKARHQYHVIDTLECGIVLQGSEVKSLREGKVSLAEAYARVKDRDVYLVGCDIPEYKQASHLNHHPRRERKLLCTIERRKFADKARESGHTLVPSNVLIIVEFAKCCWDYVRKAGPTNDRPSSRHTTWTGSCNARPLNRLSL